ncbi:MAG: hypothetical protein JWR72_2706 [Flavisolibacter sp.]|nr:hypothetical protein [Flavisolibacter sp.]
MNFVSRTRLEIAIYKDLFESGFNALVNAYSIWKAYFKDSEELSKAKESVLQLKGITLNTINLVVIYRGILVSFPNMTTSFSKAKKQALNVLDDLIRKFEFIVQLVDEFEKGDNN